MLRIVLRVMKLSHRLGLVPTAVAFLACLAQCISAAVWLPRWMVEALGASAGTYLAGLVTVVCLALLACAVGLMGFWTVAGLVEDLVRGYAVTWIASDGWAYEEREVALAGGEPVLYRLEVCGTGYPAPSNVHAPSGTAWDAETPVWAHGRREEILRRILDAHGARRGGDIRDVNGPA